MADVKFEISRSNANRTVHYVEVDVSVGTVTRVQEADVVKSYNMARRRDGQLGAVEETMLKAAMAEMSRADRAFQNAAEMLSSELDAEPPSSYVFEMLLPAKQGADFIANLDELYERDCNRHGVSRARRLYRAHCLKAAVAYWFGVCMDAAQRFRKVFYSL
jgi:hypothetical protein